FIFKGEIHHKDSRGNDSLIQAGGVQWMTAGRGIVHSEGISKAFHEKGGDLEIIQLWINLPAVHKMVQPRYQGFQADEIPHFISEDGKARLNVISGNYADLKGAVDSLTGITAYTIDLKAGGKINITEPVHRSAILYQLWGTAEVNGVSTGDTKLVVFQQDGDQIELVAQTDSTLLYLSGDPINEEVTQYGPFVMNTQTEVLEAMRDYQMGKMGILI
ncbi:MAG: pirin family protein, partial [Chitinophagales bacterium]